MPSVRPVRPGDPEDGDMLNLFRRRGEVVSVCAVPDGGDLPSFLRGDDWSFAGKVADLSQESPEAERLAHEAALETTGYALFVPR